MSTRFDTLRNQAARIVNENGRANFVLICEHASNAPPPGEDDTLWPQHLRQGHQAYDLGAAELTEAIARRLDAPAVLAGVTRLFYDINRAPGDPDCSPSVVDGQAVPANTGLNASARAWRFEAVAAPFHQAVDSLARGRHVHMISIHSCTPRMGGAERPWHVGVIYGRRNPLVEHLLHSFASDDGVVVGDNQPYSGMEVEGYTLWRHAAVTQRLAAALEFRNDVIAGERALTTWSQRTAAALEKFRAD